MADLQFKQPHANDMDQILLDYLAHVRKIQQSGPTQMGGITRVIKAFGNYLKKSGKTLPHINIEHVDAFFAEFNASYAKTTQRLYRSYLRCFLRYLHNERRLIRRNLAELLIGPPMFAKAKPPQFLRPNEILQLFDRLPHSTACELRTYAQVHLAYYLGLRPIEISRISLDDISFTKGLLTLKHRKNNRPLQLPIPEEALKAIIAYIVGGRPNSHYRSLFLVFWPDPTPMSASLTGQYLTKALREAGLPGTAYWLRHTFAQNMLEAGASIFEIKEMMGHDTIESTKKYLSIHKELMRRVLFDETI
jgi:site-specific recombinase XerD